MDKIRGKLENLLKENVSLIKKAALPVVVAASVILFWAFGGEEELVVEHGEPPGETSDSIITDLPAENVEEDAELYVDIGGEVNHPGVYKVMVGTRLFQVVEQAGGLKDTADIDSINQAEPVSDGQKIIIGSLDENSPYYTGGYQSDSVRSPTTKESGTAAVRETEYGSIVNLNLATLEELQLLPGVGPSTARKILEYRMENGNFQSPEDLKNISGIGEKTYENLKDYIEV